MNDFYNMIFLLKELQHAGSNSSFFWDHIILTFRNDLVAKFNKSLLMKLLGEIYTYNFIDSVDINEDKTNHIPQEFLQSQTSSKLPPFKLNLKIGALIILFCNLYPVSRECNRTQMIIT